MVVKLETERAKKLPLQPPLGHYSYGIKFKFLPITHKALHGQAPAQQSRCVFHGSPPLIPNSICNFMGSNPGPLTLLPYCISPSPYLCLKCHLPTCLPVWITRKLLIFQSLAKHSFLRESFSSACCVWQTYTSPVLMSYLVSTSSVEIHHIIISCIISCQSYCDPLLPLQWTSSRKRMITCHLSMASASLCPGSIVYSLAIGWMGG